MNITEFQILVPANATQTAAALLFFILALIQAGRRMKSLRKSAIWLHPFETSVALFMIAVLANSLLPAGEWQRALAQSTLQCFVTFLFGALAGTVVEVAAGRLRRE
jgi:hypothetical protein